MVMSEDSYRAIEILRFLRNASPSKPWTANELAIVIHHHDETLAARLSACDRHRKPDLGQGALRDTVAEILQGMSARGETIPSLAGVRHTLRILKRHHWVQASRGRGYWLTKPGQSVSLLEVLHACGDNAAITRCSYEQDPFPCPYRAHCTAEKFYKELAAGLAKAYSRITIEDIDRGTCRVFISSLQEPQEPTNAKT